jgi:hypothetical protein
VLHRLLGDQERPRDLLCRQRSGRPQRERNLRLEAQRRMAAGEDQLEPLVLDHHVVSSSIVASGTASRTRLLG